MDKKKIKKTLQRWIVPFIFVASTLFIFFQMLRRGSMVLESGDAADIWQTIKTYYSDNTYASYVLYKGFSTVFPYVWLYHLAIALNLNEFFFCMLYHSILFAYIVSIGTPKLIEMITNYKSKIWQRILIVIVLYWFWSRYRVLSQLMVDLPSCAFFLMAIHSAGKLKNAKGYKMITFCIITGLLCGMCINISGQYSIAALLVFVYAIIQVYNTYSVENKPRKKVLFQTMKFSLLSFFFLFVVFGINAWFDSNLVNHKGIIVASKGAWLSRGLIHFLKQPRIFYGLDLEDDRGLAIITSIYGEEEASRLLQLAANGGFGWSIREYLSYVIKDPVNFLMTYLNRMMVIISDDNGYFSLSTLLPGYTLYYLALLTMFKSLKRIRDLISEKTLLVLGCLASIIPLLAGAVEMRYCMSVHVLAYGTAICGPILPTLQKTCVRFFAFRKKHEPEAEKFRERAFPWAFIGWVMFCLICLAYFGMIGAASEVGTAVLYHW